MNYFHFKSKDNTLRIYPLVCMHLGASQCDVKFIRDHIARIKADPNGRWVYMGDGGECVTKSSKGSIYSQLLSPSMQVEACADLLEPVRDKGLFGIRGNHGHRVYKDSGLSFDMALCNKLGVPYLGPATFANFVVGRTSYDCYFHHGTDSGIGLRSKISSAEGFARFIDADAIFTAHSHVAIELQPATTLACDNNKQKIRTKLRHQYICGSAYDSRTGYAEEKGYPPLLPSYLSVQFDGWIVEGDAQRGQQCHIYRSDGQHELEHEYAIKYVDIHGG